MRILLTGATGYIGREILDDLGTAGLDVLALVRCHSEEEGLGRLGLSSRPAHLRVLPGDLLAPGWGLDRVPRFDVLVHAGASVKLARRPVGNVSETNFRAVQPIPRICRLGGARRVIHLSTAFVVPQAPPLLREQAPGPGRGSNPYETSKTAAERWLARHADLPLDILRPGIVVPAAGDPAGFFKSPLGFLWDACLRHPAGAAVLPGNPEVHLGLVRLEEVVRSVHRLLESGTESVRWWNLSREADWTLGRMAGDLAEATGRTFILDPDRSHPLFETWRPYLSSGRRWENASAGALLGGDGLTRIGREEFLSLFPSEVPASC